MLRLLCLILAVPFSLAYPQFRTYIPNGQNVKNPYHTATNGEPEIWRGVGHKALEGGGPRNPFGLAFKAHGYQWTKALCKADSDGDGKTNGEELCDPFCTWDTSKPSPQCGDSKLPSHPGFCEPVTDNKCKRLNGDPIKNFDCPDAEGLEHITLQLPRHNVPAKPTTYFCKLSPLPSDRPYHVLAAEPIITSDAVHHIDVYGCSDAEYSAIQHLFTDGADCGGLASMHCATMIGAWTVGYPGSCMNGGNYGYRIGQNAFKWALVEYHWNNPDSRSDYYDSSGIKLFYTPNLRDNDLGTMQVGQMFLNIAPNSKTTEEAVCSGTCTNRYPDTCLKMISLNIHMHLLGHSGKVKIKKYGQSVARVVAEDKNYDYNTPVEHIFYPPVEICRGDEVIVECTYSTEGKNINHYVHFGEGTNEEMCVGYITYYPQMLEAPFCTQIGKIDFCESRDTPQGGFSDRCNVDNYFESYALWKLVQDVKNENACQQSGCRTNCNNLLRCAFQNNAHRCLRDRDVRYHMTQYLTHPDSPQNYRKLGQKIRQCYLNDPRDELTVSCANSRRSLDLLERLLSGE